MNTTFSAFCHCGSVQLDIFTSSGLEQIIRCNCSICSRGKGFGMICVPANDVTIIKGHESIREYSFNTTTAPHFFCKICGIHTHHKGRAKPDCLCVNAACIDGLNTEDYSDEVVNFNGINHPSDH